MWKSNIFLISTKHNAISGAGLPLAENIGTNKKKQKRGEIFRRVFVLKTARP
jgi:hypothetical protein